MEIYYNEKKQVLFVAEANAYYDSLTYSLDRIPDGKPGITDLSESIAALTLAMRLEKNIE